MHEPKTPIRAGARGDGNGEEPELPFPTPMFPKVADRLFQSRTILLHGEITSRLAQLITAQLLALAAEGDDDITIFLHSEGGHVEAGDSIHDMVQFVSPRVKMVGTGWVASAGTHIYLSVPKADRFSLPNTRFMIHQPLGGVGGRATDIRIEAEEIMKARDRLNQVIANATGQPIERVARDTERNHWLSPEEALEYGIVGKIVANAADL